MKAVLLWTIAAGAAAAAFAVAAYAPPAHAQERAYAFYDPRLVENHTGPDQSGPVETITVTGYRRSEDLPLSYELHPTLQTWGTAVPYEIDESPIDNSRIEVYTILERQFSSGASVGFANTRLKRPEGMGRGSPYRGASVWGFRASCPTPCPPPWDW